MSKDFFRGWIAKNAHRFTDPVAYIGDEPGTFHRDWDTAKLRVCMVAASTYDNLTGNMAQPLLVRMLGEHRDDVVIERAFFPNGREDLELFEKFKIPIFSLESKRRLNDFDVIMFSCSFNGLDLNVIKMLDMCGIPVMREDRTDEHPLIVRGGQNDANPCPFMPYYDVMWVGDAEAGLRELMDEMATSLGSGIPGWKKLFKDEVLGRDGVLIPEHYRSTYDEAGIFQGWETLHPDAPLPVRAARMKDMATYVYRDTIVNYVRSMGSGELLVSRGCLAMCSFCQEGWKERPYRELDFDLAISSIEHAMRVSGTEEVTLSAFCFSSYGWSKELMSAIRSGVTPHISLTSQRVDEAAEDTEMIRMSAEAGNRSVSLGVEGCSQRLRNLVFKGASEDQIIGAAENCIRSGYNKIKLFMISNLPTETDEDRAELEPLARRCREVLDRYPDKKATVRFSWTDLTINAHTPFQWLAPTRGGRHLSPFIDGIKQHGIKVSFGAGKGHIIDKLLQFLALADDRVSEVLVKLVLQEGVSYFRQVPRHTIDALEALLAEKGLAFDMWEREKPFEEELPWYLVDYGISKAKLWKMLQAGLDGTAKQPDLSKRIRAIRGRRGPLQIKPPMDLTGTDQYLLMKLKIDKDHRFVGPGVRKQLARRALYLADVPITRTIEVASAAARPDDWVEGVEYASARLLRRLTELPPEFPAANEVFSIEQMMLSQSASAKSFSNMLCHSRIHIGHPVKTIEKAVAAFLASPERQPARATAAHPAMVTLRVDAYMGMESIEVYARPLVRRLWVSRSRQGFFLEALHSGKLSIFDLYGKFAKARAKRDVLARPAWRMDYYSEPPELGAKLCATCNKPLMYTVFGEEVCPTCQT